MNSAQLLDSLELIVARLAGMPILPIIILLSITGLGIGIFIFRRPDSAIEIQRKFYARINWKIEPTLMEREVRNTRIMGLFLIIFSLATLLFTFAFKPIFLKS